MKTMFMDFDVFQLCIWKSKVCSCEFTGMLGQDASCQQVGLRDEGSFVTHSGCSTFRRPLP